MKKFLFLIIFISTNVEARRITLDIPDEEIAIVETYVEDAEKWLRQAWAGKVNNRRDAIIREQRQFCDENDLPIKSKEESLKDGMKRIGSRKERNAGENK